MVLVTHKDHPLENICVKVQNSCWKKHQQPLAIQIVGKEVVFSLIIDSTVFIFDNTCMGNCLRKLICLLVVALAHSCCQLEARDRPRSKKSQNRQQWSIGVPRYIAGGIIGSTLGFGLGHSIQGRWWDGHGWSFTMGGLFAFFLWVNTERQNVSLAFPLTLVIATKLGETISVWLPPNRPSLAPKKITTSRYIYGGMLGTIFGFGSGHLIQGRGIASALPYTLTQVAALSTAFVVCHGCKRTQKWSILTLYAISRAIETISLWGPGIKDYKIVSTTDNSSPKLTLIPLFHRQQPKLALQFTMVVGS